MLELFMHTNKLSTFELLFNSDLGLITVYLAYFCSYEFCHRPNFKAVHIDRKKWTEVILMRRNYLEECQSKT